MKISSDNQNPRLCACRCGGKATRKEHWPYTANKYIHGHNRRGHGHSTLPQSEKRQIIFLYVNKRFSIHKIEQILDRHRDTIKRVLREERINLRTTSQQMKIDNRLGRRKRALFWRPDIDNEKILNMYEAGSSAKEIGRYFSSNSLTITKRLRKLGVCVRPNSKQKRMDFADGKYQVWNKGKHTGIVPRSAFKKGSAGFQGRHRPDSIQKMREATLRTIAKDPQSFRIQCSKGGKKGGAITAKILITNKHYSYKRIQFRSKDEIRVFKFLRRLGYKKIIYEPKIGSQYPDFYVDNKFFIEYHPLPIFRNREDNPKRYYINRRANLNNQGYRNKPLAIITNLKGGIDTFKAKIKVLKKNSKFIDGAGYNYHL